MTRSLRIHTLLSVVHDIKVGEVFGGGAHGVDLQDHPMHLIVESAIEIVVNANELSLPASR
jgi:hypothetical protein